MRPWSWLQRACGILTLAFALTLTAMAVPQLAVTDPAPNASDPEEKSWPEECQYTPADRALFLACRTEEYETLSLAEFDRRVADWEDEEAFHRMEEALKRLRVSYPEAGEGWAFLQGPLTTAFQACEARHYGGYCHRIRPCRADQAVRVRTGDVFGDEYTVFQAEAGYTLYYRAGDDAAVTVAQREKLLADYRAAVQTFLEGKTERQLLDQTAMEQALKTELARLDKAMAPEGFTLTGTELDYYYSYGPEGEN